MAGSDSSVNTVATTRPPMIAIDRLSLRLETASASQMDMADLIKRGVAGFND